MLPDAFVTYVPDCTRAGYERTVMRIWPHERRQTKLESSSTLDSYSGHPHPSALVQGRE
jgi:hypothetical protein